jgi:type I restriction enzyme S subunit
VTEPEQINKQNGWKRTTLGNALPIRYGKARSEKHGLVREATPVYGSSGVIDTFTRALTNGPTLIVGRKGTVGATYYSPEPCWPIDTVYFTEAEADKDLRFFKYLLDHLQLGKMDRSTAVPGLSRDDYNAKEVYIPEIDEQREIVAEIEKQFTRLEAGVAGLRRMLANLKRYRAAVLKAACEGKLVPTEAELACQEGRLYETGGQLLERILTERRQKWSGKGKYKDPVKPDTSNLPLIPEGWVWATVEQISSWLPGSIQSGPFGSHLLHSEFVSEGILAIGIDNVQDGNFSLGSNHRIKPEKYSVLSKFTARTGDVVVTVMATVGRVCVLPENLEPAIITKHCYRITPSPKGIKSRFLALTLRADVATRWHIFGNVRGQTRPGINGPILKAAPVAIPPILEQKRIVAEVERRLSVVEELEAVLSTNFQRATRLRQSILQRAFEGKLAPR